VTAANANTSNSMRGIVDEDGTAIILLPGLTFTNGSSVSFSNTYMLDGMLCCGSSINSTVTAVPPSPDLLDVPRPYQITGQISQSQFSGTVVRTSTAVPLDFSLTPSSALYTRPLSLASLAGTYTTPVRFTVGTTNYDMQYTLNIDNAGSMVGNLVPGTCLLAGQVSVPNPNRNLFRVANLIVSGCTGPLHYDARRNGVHRGLGYLADDAARPGTTSNRLVLFAVMENHTGFWPLTTNFR
jgi:hypothetical protein